MNSNKNELTPSEYFNIVKDKKQHITDEDLAKVYDNCLTLLNKYKITGQTKGMKKLIFHLECIEKEREIVKMGINTFIYKDDIEKYIDNIAKDVVKIIELENYEREIPDEIIETISQVKDKFSQLYVVFTDYTGKIEQEVIKERKNSGQRIVWEEGFREGFKIGYGQVMRKMAIGLVEHFKTKTLEPLLIDFIS